ncbi:MAG: hypothetical protein GF383_12675 [Candidatus Lokiarchaeota archaeon]|nr:hypothetical protein [Candidatus Lokiarchaeota archaeon]MBD3341913.1 hypothetical protein [Candidatus Lokiarchaeota archaeon]
MLERKCKQIREKNLFRCEECGADIPPELIKELKYGKTIYCENCGKEFNTNLLNIAHPKEHSKEQLKKKSIKIYPIARSKNIAYTPIIRNFPSIKLPLKEKMKLRISTRWQKFKMFFLRKTRGHIKGKQRRRRWGRL